VASDDKRNKENKIRKIGKKKWEIEIKAKNTCSE
jgi:hypothetical protein